MTTRTDIHSPANLNPEDYQYVDVFYQGSDAEQHFRSEVDWSKEWTGGNHYNRNTCDHCGAHFAYGVAMLHVPTDEIICVGWQCADNAFGYNSKRDYDRARMMTAVARARNYGRARCQALELIAKHPEISGLADDVEFENSILRDLTLRLFKDGHLSPKQIEFAAKLLAARVKAYEWLEAADERIAAALREPVDGYTSDARDALFGWGDLKPARLDALYRRLGLTPPATVAADVVEVPEGAITITGQVLSTKWEASDYHSGGVCKMLVADDRGFKVWGTAPSALLDSGLTIKGLRVEFVATVKRSERDRNFGTFKRPRCARFLTVPVVEVDFVAEELRARAAIDEMPEGCTVQEALAVVRHAVPPWSELIVRVFVATHYGDRWPDALAKVEQIRPSHIPAAEAVPAASQPTHIPLDVQVEQGCNDWRVDLPDGSQHFGHTAAEAERNARAWACGTVN